MKINIYILVIVIGTALHAIANVDIVAPADRLGVGIITPIERNRVAIIDHGFDLEHVHLRTSFMTRLFAIESDKGSLMMRLQPHDPSDPKFGHLSLGTEPASIIGAQDGLGLYPKAKIIPIDYAGDLVFSLRKAIDAYKRMPFIAINFSHNISYANTNAQQGFVDPMKGEAKYLFKTLLNNGVILFISAGVGTNREFANDAFRQDILELATQYPDQVVIAGSGFCETEGCETDPQVIHAGKAYQHYLSVDARRIKVARPGDTYGEISGSSAAAPLLLGAFLNLEDLYWRVVNENVQPKRIVEIMKSTAIRKDKNGLPLSPALYGRGVFDYIAAEKYIHGLR